MAQYYQVIGQTDKTNQEEIQAIYPNIIDNQSTVHYLVNQEDQALAQNQQIIVTGGEQYMVLDNLIDQNALTFQNQPFEIAQGQQQQIFYMESSDALPIDTLQQSSVVLNHPLQNTTNSPQKVIMVQQGQHTQPAMVIQQPVIPRQIQKPIQRIQTPQQINTPRVAFTPQQQLPRPINRMNVARGPIARPMVPNRTVSSTQPGVIDNPTPRVVSGLVRTGTPNRGILRHPRGGIVRPNIPRPNLQAPIRGMQPIPRPPLNSKMRGGRINPTIVGPQNIEENTNSDNEESNNYVPMLDYQPFVNDRKKADGKNITQGVARGVMQGPPRLPLNPKVKGRINPQGIGTEDVATSVPEESSSVMGSSNYQLLQTERSKTMTGPIGRITQSPGQEPKKIPAVLKNFIPPPEIKDIILKTQHTAEFQNSIRMFVLLPHGEQRLITFTMPKENCTIQEILEQVGVPIQQDTKIAISETNADGINLVVAVCDDEEEGEGSDTGNAAQANPQQSQMDGQPKSVTPELPAAPEPDPPKYVAGMLAVCSHCGFLSDDFNKCIRCKSKLPEGIRAVPSSDLKGLDMKQKTTISMNLKSNGAAKMSHVKKKVKPRIIEQEPVILTLSSDDETEDDNNTSSLVNRIITKAESQMIHSIHKEPTISDIKENSVDTISSGVGSTEESGGEAMVSASIFCRTVRIGSYKFSPEDDIIINSNELILKVPSPKDSKIIKTIKIHRRFVVKVLVNFQKLLPVIFYYLTPSIGEVIRNELEMVAESEPYFDPLSKEEAYKRITLLPECISEDVKWVFESIYKKDKMEELNAKEANNILIRTCPKENQKPINNIPLSSSDVQQLLIYPQGKGGISINTEDYLCLAQDQFLNDVIIDFYLKYLILNLPTEQQEKIHVFSNFFYKRLTTKPSKPSRRSHPLEMDPNLTAAQKRHSRVKNWTKNVNLFEKDFIVVPINENAHWFLAIICFPGMDGPHTLDGKPCKLEPSRPKKKNITIGNVTITQLKVEKLAAAALNCEEGEISDKDEAEGDESELDSGEDEELAGNLQSPISISFKNKVPVKQPCILIFDSLAGASRARVVATLRDYLSCEYKIKQGTVKIFNKDVIKGACPKVPQQTNYTDCGLYLLQYVESFLQKPIKDYRIPINELKSWFDELTVTKKREDISNLIKELMVKYNKDVNMLPCIQFPTLNGELIEPQPEDEEEQMEEDEDELDRELENELEKTTDSEVDNNQITSSQVGMDVSSNSSTSPLKPSDSSTHDGFTEEPVFEEKVTPDIKEHTKSSNRDTMSYLKSKRIERHKAGEAVDLKRFKPSE